MRRWLLFLILLLVGCDASSKQPVRVYAASSLTEVFKELERTFERTNPGVDVRLNFAGSQTLRLQLEEGAPAEVFASANEVHMQALVDREIMQPARIFATNRLVVIVPEGNPAGIAQFDDLGEARRLVIGMSEVPVGIYTDEAFDRADRDLPGFDQKVRASIVSREANVRLVRAKVELGEADAAVVYRTDLSESVDAIEIPDPWNPRARYPIALHSERSSPAAREFIEFVLSDDGQNILAEHGFGVGP